MQATIPREIVPSARPAKLGPRQVEREFHARIAAGARLVAAGSARKRPRTLLSRGYTPKHVVRLFDTTYYLSTVRQNEDLRFFVGYVARDRAATEITDACRRTMCCSRAPGASTFRLSAPRR